MVHARGQSGAINAQDVGQQNLGVQQRGWDPLTGEPLGRAEEDLADGAVGGRFFRLQTWISSLRRSAS
jgi:hypothetical protein